MLSRINLFRPRRVLLLATIGVLGLLAGRLVGMFAAPTSPPDQIPAASTVSDESAAFIMTAPETMHELVDKADIIVVGTVGDKLGKPSFVEYDDHGKAVKAEAMNVPQDWETTFHDFAVNVERVIKDDGTLQAQSPLIVRTKFARETPAIDVHDRYPGIYSGDRYLMFLTQEPDHKTYGFYYAAGSRLLIDGPSVAQSDGRRSPLPFAKGVAPEEFIGQVRRMSKP